MFDCIKCDISNKKCLIPYICSIRYFTSKKYFYFVGKNIVKICVLSGYNN